MFKTIFSLAVLIIISFSNAHAAEFTQADYQAMLHTIDLKERGCKITGDPVAGIDSCVTPGASRAMIAGCRQGATKAGEEVLTQMYGSYTSQDYSQFTAKTSSWGHVTYVWSFQVLPSLNQEDADIVYYLILPAEDFYTASRAQLIDLNQVDLRVTTPINIYKYMYVDGGKSMSSRAKSFYTEFFKGDATAIRAQIENVKKAWPSIKTELRKDCVK